MAKLIEQAGEIAKRLMANLSIEFTDDQLRKRLLALGYAGGELHELVKKFQEFNGLLIDGDAGEKTIEKLMTPRYGRCALPDVLSARNRICKWNKTDIQVNVEVEIPTLQRRDDVTYDAFVVAGNQWAEVCGLNVTTVRRNRANSDIIAQGGTGRRYNLDGPGGTLAWSELPCSGRDSILQQMYDLDENWTFEFLIAVACHELGHAIGLDHIPGTGSLMNPTYDPRITKPQARDRAEAIRRYGLPKPKGVPDVPDHSPAPVPAPDAPEFDPRDYELTVRVTDFRRIK